MKSFGLISLILALTVSWAGALSQDPPQEETAEDQQTLQEEEAPPLAPPKPPRVVGQAQTQAEWQAWQTVQQAPTPSEKASLSEEFLQNYPESGLTPFAHREIALNALQSNDLETFVEHAEEAVQELPNFPELLARLGFIHAEKGRADQAIERANQALNAIGEIEKPAPVSALEWVSQKAQLESEANYALGRAYLEKSTGASSEESEDPNLQKAINHLQQAISQDPQHDYAYFRLGYIQRNRNNVDGSLEAYGRAAAIGGVAAGPAQNSIDQILTIVKENMPESEWADKNASDVIETQRQELSEAVNAHQEKLRQEAQQIEEEERQRQMQEQAQPAPPTAETPTQTPSAPPR